MPFYVTTKDYEGNDVTVEVSEQIYLLFEGERKAKERERNEHRRHGDDRELQDYLLYAENISLFVSAEESFLQKERMFGVRTILESCTPIQRERFYLNRICGYSYTKIAGLQKCGAERIRKSVNTVLKKLKNVF